MRNVTHMIMVVTLPDVCKSTRSLGIYVRGRDYIMFEVVASELGVRCERCYRAMLLQGNTMRVAYVAVAGGYVRGLR